MEEQEKTAAEAALSEERVEQAESFQTLIRGKYREDYLKALEEALQAQARETERYLAYRELQAKAEALKARRPDFDLERELENPCFARLLENGVPVELLMGGRVGHCFTAAPHPYTDQTHDAIATAFRREFGLLDHLKKKV